MFCCLRRVVVLLPGGSQVRSVKADMEACKEHMVQERKEHDQALRRLEEEAAARLAETVEEARKEAERREQEHQCEVDKLKEVSERVTWALGVRATFVLGGGLTGMSSYVVTD